MPKQLLGDILALIVEKYFFLSIKFIFDERELIIVQIKTATKYITYSSTDLS